MKLPKNTQKGFTLIELLVVIGILGVLAAVVVPNVSRFMGKGQTEAAATEKATLQTAVSSMMVDNNLKQLPNPLTGAVAKPAGYAGSLVAGDKDPAAVPTWDYSGLNGTSDMSIFPDISVGAAKGSGADGVAFQAGDVPLGWVLWQCKVTHAGATLVNYVQTQKTKGVYTIDQDGTVHQIASGYGPNVPPLN